MKNILTTTTKTSLVLGITILLFAGQVRADYSPETVDQMRAMDMTICPYMIKGNCRGPICTERCGGTDRWSEFQQKCVSAEVALNEMGGLKSLLPDLITLEYHRQCSIDDTPLSDKWSLLQKQCVSAKTACEEKYGKWTNAGCDGGSIVALLTKRADAATADYENTIEAFKKESSATLYEAVHTKKKIADKANKLKCRAALKDLYPNNGNGYWNCQTNGCQTPEALNGCPDKGSEEVDENGVKVTRCKK